MKFNKVNTIFFDLDGTLLSPRKRLHHLFNELTKCNITFDEYWKLKDKGFNQHAMLDYVGYSSDSYDKFKIKWLNNVEREDLLLLDEIFPEVLDTLNILRKRNVKLLIVTNRQSFDGLKLELENLRINNFFSECLSTCQKISKSEVILQEGIDVRNAVFIGDSEEDMLAARQLGIPGILISRLKKDFNKIDYDLIISSLSEIFKEIDFEK